MLGDDTIPVIPFDTPLQGHLVRLSPYVSSDATELFTALDHDQVWTLVPGRPVDAAQVDRVLTSRNGRYPWVVRLVAPGVGGEPGASTATVVGTTSYLDVQPGDLRCEIGYTAYSPVVWGSGVNTECKLLLLDAAFTAGFERVQLKTDIRNERSQAAIAGLGATREGVLRRYQRRADGSMRDTVMYSILLQEWPQVRDRLRARLHDHLSSP